MRKILFLCLCILVLSRVAADDFGDFSGSYDYGGWSSSDSGWSSSSSDWSSSSSSGWSSSSSGWDSGYSSSSSSHSSYSSSGYSSGYSSSSGSSGYSGSSGSSSYSSSSSGSSGSSSYSSSSGSYNSSGRNESYSSAYDGLFKALNKALMLFVVAVFVFVVIMSFRLRKQIENKPIVQAGSNTNDPEDRFQPPSFTRQTQRKRETVPPGAMRTSIYDVKPIISYSSVDPNFSVEAFKQRLSNIYVRLQNAWQAKDLEPVRPFLTDALYNQYDMQLSNYRHTKTTNVVEHIAVLGISITGWKQQGGEDVIIAVLRSRINDYVIDDATGQVVRGSRTAEKFMEYEYALSRKTGVKTASAKGVRTVNCPNCGSPIDINQSAVCKYCGSTLQAAPEDWVISGIKGLSQRTVGR